MKDTVSRKIKARDIAIGFFGWVIIHNLLFLLMFGILPLFMITTCLVIVVVPLVLFKKKRGWISIGIISAVIINAGIWIYSLSLTHSRIQMLLWAVGLPFPIGGAIWSQ